MKISEKKLTIGPYQVNSVPTGEFALDGGAMFGTVPKVLWEKSNPPDEANRIPLEARALLLKSASRAILVDCGNGGDFIQKYGEKLGPKFAEIYQVESAQNSLLGSLKNHGLTPEDITDVVLTHLHFDHAGGSTKYESGKLVPTFKRATYYVQERNLTTAQAPNLREKASYFKANFEPLLNSGQLKILQGPMKNEIPGISSFISDGHTLGHQCVLVEGDNSQGLIYCGDVIPTSSHVRLPWVMGYDLNPLLIIEEKRQLLQWAAEKGYYLFFEHDPYCEGALLDPKPLPTGEFGIREKFVFVS